MSQFKRAVIVKPGKDYSSLRDSVSEMDYSNNGYPKDTNDLLRQIEESLLDFDPGLDLVVPVGNAIMCFLVGLVLGRKFPQSPVNMAIYSDKEYSFYEVSNGAIERII